jgi:hypothetical protein
MGLLNSPQLSKDDWSQKKVEGNTEIGVTRLMY